MQRSATRYSAAVHCSALALPLPLHLPHAHTHTHTHTHIHKSTRSHRYSHCQIFKGTNEHTQTHTCISARTPARTHAARHTPRRCPPLPPAGRRRPRRSPGPAACPPLLVVRPPQNAPSHWLLSPSPRSLPSGRQPIAVLMLPACIRGIPPACILQPAARPQLPLAFPYLANRMFVEIKGNCARGWRAGAEGWAGRSRDFPYRNSASARWLRRAIFTSMIVAAVVAVLAAADWMDKD